MGNPIKVFMKVVTEATTTKMLTNKEKFLKMFIENMTLVKNKMARMTTASVFAKEMVLGQGQKSYKSKPKRKSLHEVTVRVEMGYIIIYSLATTTFRYILIVEETVDFDEIFDDGHLRKRPISIFMGHCCIGGSMKLQVKSIR
eukprot:2492877-Amphidinium_carterae.2